MENDRQANWEWRSVIKWIRLYDRWCCRKKLIKSYKIEDLTEKEEKKNHSDLLYFECFGENKTHFTAEINSIETIGTQSMDKKKKSLEYVTVPKAFHGALRLECYFT